MIVQTTSLNRRRKYKLAWQDRKTHLAKSKRIRIWIVKGRIYQRVKKISNNQIRIAMRVQMTKKEILESIWQQSSEKRRRTRKTCSIGNLKLTLMNIFQVVMKMYSFIRSRSLKKNYWWRNKNALKIKNISWNINYRRRKKSLLKRKKSQRKKLGWKSYRKRKRKKLIF